LEDEVVGEEATKLFADAQAMLDKLEQDQTLSCAGVIGLFPANSVGDDVEIYADESRSEVLQTLRFLRQQTEKKDGFPNYCLADYVAPKGTKADYIGGFAVTGGIGEDDIIRRYKDEEDDYNAILAGSVADRLAEAF